MLQRPDHSPLSIRLSLSHRLFQAEGASSAQSKEFPSSQLLGNADGEGGPRIVSVRSGESRRLPLRAGVGRRRSQGTLDSLWLPLVHCAVVHVHMCVFSSRDHERRQADSTGNRITNFPQNR